MDDYDEDEPNIEEQEFHNNVREQIIFLLLFLLLYLLSFALLGRFKRKGREDYYSTDEDEVTVYRISTWLCTFSLAVSIGAVLLLPISIISNEVLIIYPNSYYIKWLNSSLIQGLWNYIFLFSNLSLFVLLPFAYLFTESEGFFGHRKGLTARVYETFIVLALLGMVVLGMTYVISALIDRDKSSFQTLLNLWSYYLPFLYSYITAPDGDSPRLHLSVSSLFVLNRSGYRSNQFWATSGGRVLRALEGLAEGLAVPSAPVRGRRLLSGINGPLVDDSTSSQ
ncbi:hypothetical protein Zmor_027300 [Zophobas morio]|uniref:Protein LMBR1L n=1 Tax=Zophobas morio TaxID=2755281 RepID=A0AA38HQK2_9CUCU|nr:hypothetical protein Zmor_027300 [Zophobas morio]